MYKLSPSDFKYLYKDCKHCYYQKAKVIAKELSQSAFNLLFMVKSEAEDENSELESVLSLDLSKYISPNLILELKALKNHLKIENFTKI